MSTKPFSALSQIKLSLYHLKTWLWSTVVHIRAVCSWEQVFCVASDESQVVWRLFNMTHILQTNSNTAGPVVLSKNIKPLKTWLTCLEHMLLCVMEMFKNRCVPPLSWSAFSGLHWEKNSLMITEGSTVVEGESVLLQMLLLSESDNHLGKESKHMAKLSVLPAQGQRGDQLWPIHPADSQVFTSLSASFVHKRERK